MLRLAKFSIRRPWTALAVWIAIAGALTAIGTGLAGSLSPSVVVVPGTESSRAQDLADEGFGPNVLVPILLEGPKTELDKQGPTLVTLLARRPDTRVMSAWDAGETGEGLRPRADAAMIVASVSRTEKQMVDTYQEQIDETVANVVKAPVVAHVSGQPSVDRALKDESIDATRIAMYIGIGVLFVLLLVGLRAPLAAAALTGLGATTVGVGFGVMTLVGKVVDVDSLAIAFGALTGLALGVGYGLMIMHRFHEAEREEGGMTRGDAAAHAAAAVSSAGRAVLIGGTALVVALVLAAIFSNNEVLTSVGIGAVLCSTLGIGGAIAVVPAVLTLAGHKLDAWSLPAPRLLTRAWDAFAVGGASLVQRTALFTGFAATALLAAIAIPALSIETGPPGITNLPSDNAARQDFERINDVMGAGWATPFNIVVASDTQPLTSATMLRKLEDFQRELAKDDRVASVVGPGEFRAQTRDLGKLPASLEDSAAMLKGGKKDLGKLENGLGQAGSGALTLQQGLRDAASGAAQLQSGSGDAQNGAGQLRDGLDAARSGALQISDGLGQALAGANSLKAGAAQALAGSRQISGGLGQAAPTVQEGLPLVREMAANVQAGSQAVDTVTGEAQAAAAKLDEALTNLQAIPGVSGDPSYQAAVAAVQAARASAGSVSSTLGGVQGRMQSASGVAGAFAGQVAELSEGLQQLLSGSTQLTNGIAQLSKGNADLATGIGKLSGGGGDLTSGLTQLRDGAGALQAGLGMLTAGTGQLGAGLGSATGPVGELAAGLDTMHTGVAKFRGQLPSPKDLEQLQAQAPGLFDSGYFVLAAIDGATAGNRNQASFAVNLDRGGTAGQIVVIAKQPPSDPATQALGDDLSDMAADFGDRNRLDTAVGGPAGQLGDFRDDIGDRIWPVVIIIAAAIALLLMVLLRAVVLPLVAVAFDLLTAAATFGVVDTLFVGDDPIMGGPGYLDPVTVIMVFAAVFGLTMVFEVYLLEMSRVAFVASGDARGALRDGLRRSAAAATGVAFVSVAISIPFIATDLINLRQVGTAVAVAVILDALIVRPVLLPAAMQVLGRWVWWPTTRSAPPAPPSDGHRPHLPHLRRPKEPAEA